MTTTTTDFATATTVAYSTSELLAVTSARALLGRRLVFAGIGIPTVAVALARATTSPDLHQVFESGVCGAHPHRLPQTVADAPLATGAECILSMHALFGHVLQGGHIDVGFLGAAQIDRFGSLNSTVIGDYAKPTVRLPGSGGAVEVMANAHEVFVVLRRHTPRALVDRLDFCTSPSPRRAQVHDPRVRTRGSGVTTLITELGIFRADSTGELVLTTVQPEVTVDQVIAATGWDLKVADDVAVNEAPSSDELALLRTEIDPTRVYLR
ncbi:CoA-transferase subunit beta [Rhodococcus sp. NPDC057014]|uniref:CoA-transferase subunit beta n=1 Tax=Rhodococcus sp. NPDC057014 TaxID=3346000 RepID=UPI003635D7F8